MRLWHPLHLCPLHLLVRCRRGPALTSRAGNDATSRAALNVGLIYYEVVPQDDAGKRRFWPLARLAFDWFLATATAAEGHEQFERTLGVPFRMARIAEFLGPAPTSVQPARDVTMLQWPDA